MFELIKSPHMCYDHEAMFGEPRETYADIFEKVEPYIQETLKLKMRLICYWADAGLIEKSVRVGRHRSYPPRTVRDIRAMYFIRTKFKTTTHVKLIEAINNSHARLYEIIERLAMLDTLLTVFQATTKKSFDPDTFITNNNERDKLKTNYFKMLNEGIHPINIDLKFEQEKLQDIYKYIQDVGMGRIDA